MPRIENKTSHRVTVYYSPYRDTVTLKPGSVADLDRVVDLKVCVGDVALETARRGSGSRYLTIKHDGDQILVTNSNCRRCRSRERLLGRTMCARCLDVMKLARQKDYRERRMSGICVVAGCDRPAEKIRCPEHVQEMLDYLKTRKTRKKEA